MVVDHGPSLLLPVSHGVSFVAHICLWFSAFAAAVYALVFVKQLVESLVWLLYSSPPFLSLIEKTKNLLFNGAKAVVGKIWSGEEKCPDSQFKEQHTACSQTLLRGQTLIGQDGKLTRTNAVQGKFRLLVSWSKIVHSKEILNINFKQTLWRTTSHPQYTWCRTRS